MHVVARDNEVAHTRELSKHTVPRLSDVWRTPKSSYRGYVLILPIKHCPRVVLRSKTFLFIGQPTGPAWLLVPKGTYVSAFQYAAICEVVHMNK